MILDDDRKLSTKKVEKPKREDLFDINPNTVNNTDPVFVDDGGFIQSEIKKREEKEAQKREKQFKRKLEEDALMDYFITDYRKKKWGAKYEAMKNLAVSEEELFQFQKYKTEWYKYKWMEEQKEDPNSSFHKNHSNTPFKDKIKIMYNQGKIEAKIRDDGYLKKRNVTKEQKLRELKNKLRNSGQDTIYVSNDLIYTNEDDGDISGKILTPEEILNKQIVEQNPNNEIPDLNGMSINERQKAIQEYAKKEKDKRGQYLNAIQIEHLLNKSQLQRIQAEPRLEQNKVLYQEHEQKIEDLNRQMNGFKQGVSTITGGFGQVVSDKYKRRNMLVATGASVITGGIAGAVGASATVAEGLDIAVDLVVGVTQDIGDQRHFIETMENRNMTYDEYVDTITMSIVTNLGFRYGFKALGKAGKWTLSNGYSLTTKAFSKFDDELIPRIKTKLQNYLGDSVLAKSGDVSYRYDPLTGETVRTYIDEPTLKAIKQTIKETAEEIEEATDIKYAEDPFSYGRRKQDIREAAINNTEVKTYSKAEVNNAVDKLGKEFDESAGTQKLKEKYNIEVNTRRKQKTQQRTIKKEIEQIKKDVKNPRLDKALNDTYDKFHSGEISYKEAFDELIDIQKRNYIDRGLEGFIDENRLAGKIDDTINNLPEKYKTTKREFTKREKYKDAGNEIELESLSDKDKAALELMWDNSKLKERILENIKDLDEATQQKIISEMKNSYYNELIAKNKLTKEAIIEASNGDLFQALNDIDETLEQNKIHREKLDEEFEQSKAKVEEEVKNSAGEKIDEEDIKVDTEEVKEEEPQAEVRGNGGENNSTKTNEEPKENVNNTKFDNQQPETLDELATEYVNNKFDNKKDNPSNPNNEAAKIVKQDKIEIFEAIDGDKTKAVSKLYDQIDKLKDGDYIEYISKEDGYVTGAIQLGNKNRYVYQYHIKDTSSELLGIKLHNIDEINSIGSSQIILLPNKKGDKVIRFQGEAARGIIATKNNRKLMTLYVDSLIKNEIQKEIIIRSTANKLGVKSGDLSTNSNKFIGFHTSLNVVQRIENAKNRIISALDKKIKLGTDGEMSLGNLLKGNFNAEDFIGLINNKDMLDMLIFLNKNGENYSSDIFTGMNMEDINKAMNGSQFFKDGNFVGVTVTSKLDGSQYTFTTPQEVALFYMMNEHSVKQISIDNQFSPVEQEFMKYLYEITPQEQLNKVFIDRLDDEVKAIFKSFDPENPDLITTASMISDLREYILNMNELDVAKLSASNKEHPLFRIFQVEKDTLKNADANVKGNMGVFTERISSVDNVNIMQYIGNSLFRDGYNMNGVLNQVMPIMDAIYTKFDEMQEVTFNRDMYVQKGVVTANKVKNKKGGHAYKLSKIEAAEILNYANNIENNIKNTWTTKTETKTYTIKQAQRMVEKDMHDVLTNQYTNDPFQNIHTKGKSIGKIKDWKTIKNSKWFKKFDEQFRWLNQKNRTIIKAWDEMVETGIPNELVNAKLDSIRNFTLDRGEILDDYFDDLMTTRTKTTTTTTRNHTDLTIEEVVKKHLETGEVTPELKMLIDQIANKEKIKVNFNELGEKIEQAKALSSSLIEKYNNKIEFTESDITNFQGLMDFLTPLQRKDFNTWLKNPNKNVLSPELFNKINNISTEITGTFRGTDDLINALDKKISSLNKNLYNASQGKVRLKNGMNIIDKIRQAANLNYIELPDNIKGLINQYENLNDMIISYKTAKSIYKTSIAEDLHEVKGGRLTPREMMAANEILKGVNKKNLIEGLVKLLSADYGVASTDGGVGNYFKSQLFINRMQNLNMYDSKISNLLTNLILKRAEYGEGNMNLFYLHVDPNDLTPEVKASLDAKWEDFKVNVYEKYVDDFPMIQGLDGKTTRPTIQQFYAQILQFMDDVDNSTSRVYLRDRAGLGSNYMHVGKLAYRFDSFEKFSHFLLGFSEDMDALDLQHQWVKGFDNNISLLAEREALGGVELRKFIGGLRDITDQQHSYITLQTIREANRKGLTVPKINNEGEIKVQADILATDIVDKSIKDLDNLYYKATNNRLPEDIVHQMKNYGYEYFKDKPDIFWNWDKDKGKAIAGNFLDNEQEYINGVYNYIHNKMPEEFKTQINQLIEINKAKSLSEFYGELSSKTSQRYLNLFDTDKVLRTDLFDNTITATKNIADNLEYYKEHSALTYGDQQANITHSALNSIIGMGKSIILQTVGAFETLFYDLGQFIRGNNVRRGLPEFFNVIMRLPPRAAISTVMLAGAILDTGFSAAKIAGMTINGMVDLLSGHRIKWLDTFEQLPHLNEMALASYISNRSIDITDGIKGQLLNHLMSMARKGDNKFVMLMNRLSKTADSFQGGLELYKQIWSLDHYEQMVGLNWNSIGKEMKARLNAFGIDNKTLDKINEVLERVNVTDNGIPKAGAVWELMTKSNIELLQLGLDNTEIQAIRKFENAMNISIYKRSHDNNRALFNRVLGNQTKIDKLAANTKFGFYVTPLNVLSDYLDNMSTYIDENGMVYTSDTFRKANGFRKWVAESGKKTFYTVAVATVGGLAYNYMSPIYNMMRAKWDDERQAKAMAEFNANYNYNPFNNWKNMFVNGIAGTTGGLDFSAMSSSVNIVANKMIPLSQIVYPFIVGHNKPYDLLNLDNDGEQTWVQKTLKIDRNTYEAIRNSGGLELAKMLLWGTYGFTNELAATKLKTMIFDKAYNNAEKAEILTNQMKKVGQFDASDLRFGNGINETDLGYDIDRMSGEGTKSSIEVKDLANEILSMDNPVARAIKEARNLPAYIKARQNSFDDNDDVIVAGNVEQGDEDNLKEQTQYKYDDVVDRKWFMKFVDNMKLIKNEAEDIFNTSFDDKLDNTTLSSQDIEEAEFDYKRTVATFALNQYKKDHNGDLSGLTEDKLKEYYIEADKKMKGGMVNAVQGQMIGMYYEDQMNMIDAYMDNYLMGIIPEQQLEKSFEEIFSKDEIQKRMNDMFTLEEQNWINKNIINVMGGNKYVNKAKVVVMSEMLSTQQENLTLKDIQLAVGVTDEMVNSEIDIDGLNEVKELMKSQYGINMSDEQIKLMAYTGITPDELAMGRNQITDMLKYKDELGDNKPRTFYNIIPKDEYERNKLISTLASIAANPINAAGIILGNTYNDKFKQTSPREKAMEYIGIKEPKKGVKQDNINTQETPQLSPYAAASEYTQADLEAAINRIPKLHPNDKVKDQNMRTLLKVAAPYAQKYNVPIEVILAQFSMESGYGTKVKGKNNYFNMTTGSSWTGSYTTTRNKANGKIYHWRDYDSLEQGVEDFCKWWNKGKINGIYTRNADGSVNLEALKIFAEEPHYYKTILGQIETMKKRIGNEVYDILGQSKLIAKSYPVDSISLQTYAEENIGTSNTETLSLDTTLQMMGVQPNDEDIDSTLEVKGIHPLARRMIYEYRDYDPKNGDNRVHQYQVQGGNMPDVDGVQDLGWDASIIGYLGSDYITSKSVSAEQLYRNNGIEIKPNEPLESGDLVFLDNKNGDIFHVNVVIAALNNGTVITISGNENEEGMGIKAYNRSDIKKAKRLPMRNDGSVSGARKETK